MNNKKHEEEREKSMSLLEFSAKYYPTKKEDYEMASKYIAEKFLIPYMHKMKALRLKEKE